MLLLFLVLSAQVPPEANARFRRRRCLHHLFCRYQGSPNRCPLPVRTSSILSARTPSEMLSKTLFIDRKYVFYAQRAYPRVKKEREKVFCLFHVFSRKRKETFTHFFSHIYGAKKNVRTPTTQPAEIAQDKTKASTGNPSTIQESFVFRS